MMQRIFSTFAMVLILNATTVAATLVTAPAASANPQAVCPSTPSDSSPTDGRKSEVPSFESAEVDVWDGGSARVHAQDNHGLESWGSPAIPAAVFGLTDEVPVAAWADRIELKKLLADYEGITSMVPHAPPRR